MKNHNLDPAGRGITDIKGVYADDVSIVRPLVDLHVNGSILPAGVVAVVPKSFDLLRFCEELTPEPEPVPEPTPAVTAEEEAV